MPKVRISKVPMQYGGQQNMAPISYAERDKWERMQSAARMQGYQGDAHNREAGYAFMKEHGVDPSRLAAYQQDMLQQKNASPWGHSSNVSRADNGWSGADAFYGPKTANQRYTHYSVQHNNEAPVEFGTNWEAATAYSNNLQAKRDNEWAGFGDPKSNINYREPVAQAPAPTAKPLGLASNGFPTREEAIAKYKARKAMGQPQASSYTPEEKPQAPGMDPISYLRSTGKEMYKFGGDTGMKRVRISGTPTMAAGGNYVPGGPGGYGNQQQGHGYALDRFWSSPAGYPGATSQVQPFARIGNTLPEAQDGGDINAEKQERVLGDFDQDGQQELMNVNGPSHAEGGKDVNVPSNSFVFSDTKDLKIKDPKVLAMFGITTMKRGGFTPAEIAKKYDLNKFKRAMSDPEADDYAVRTAQMMSDNYLAKLNKLAEIQEDMKHHMGMENSSRITRNGGPAPRYQNAGPFTEADAVAGENGDTPAMEYGNDAANQAVASNVNPVYNMYPNVLTAEGYKHDRPNAANMQSFVQQSIQPRPQQGTKPVPFIPPTEAGNAQYDAMRRAGWDGKEDPGAWAQRTQPEAVQKAIVASGMKNRASDAVAGNDMGTSIYGPRWTNFNPQGPDWNPTLQNVPGQGEPVVGPDGMPVPQKDPYMDLVPWAGNNYTPPPVAAVPPAKKGDKKSKSREAVMGVGVDPNFYGNLQNILQIASLRKFQPYEAVPQAVIPDAVFLDPTRAIAAQQELARMGSEMDQSNGNPQAARAMALARQGVAGKQAADTIGQYHNQNVVIANQANQQSAAIMTELMSKQAARLADLNKGNFLSDREYQKQMKNLQEEFTYRMQQQHDADVKRLRYNKANPYFEMNRSGYYNLKPGVTGAKLQEIYNGSYASGKKGVDSYNALYQEALRKGLDDKSARDYAWNEAGLGQHRKITYDAQNPARQKVSESGIYEDKYGGEVMNRPLMKKGGPTDLLKKTALKKFVS